MYNDGYEVSSAARVRIAKATVESMLLRASRIVNEAESRNGRVAIMPADTFRMNLMAIFAALSGETSAERLAIDDEGAAVIAEILHETNGQVSLTLPAALIEQAREMYGTAALAGKHVETLDGGGYLDVARPQYDAVAAAAMMLGEILSLVAKAESGERDAG